MCNNITKSLVDGKAVIGIFLDLSKAFDILNLNILLDQLNYRYFDIHGVILKWFKSYLTSRTQYISLQNINSTIKLITCCVPLGSILGSLLILLYIDDMSNCFKLSYFILFADDTTIFLSDNNLNNLIEIVNNELIHLCNWFRANKLSLNVSKTNFITFGNKCDVY